MANLETAYLESLTSSQHEDLKEFWQKFLHRLDTTKDLLTHGNESTDSIKKPGKTSSSNAKKDTEHHDMKPEPISNTNMKKSALGSSTSLSAHTNCLSNKGMGIWQEFIHMCGRFHPDRIVLRFMRARKWNLDKALDMLWSAILWRMDFGAAAVLEEGEGKLPEWMLEKPIVYFLGEDKSSRPVIYLNARYYDRNAAIADLVKRHAVYIMELAKDYFVPEQVETVTIVLDLKNMTLSNFDMTFTSFLISCLESYYPESLGLCMLVNAPFIFNGVWSMVKPLLDPVVARKIQFVKPAEIAEEIDERYIPIDLTGKCAWNYAYVKGAGNQVECEGWKLSVEDALDFKNATAEWSSVGNGGSEKRQQAIEKTRNYWCAYEKTRPRTQYHHLGVIDDQRNVKWEKIV